MFNKVEIGNLSYKQNSLAIAGSQLKRNRHQPSYRMKNAHKFFLGLMLLIIVSLGLVLRPVPMVTEDEALTVRGEVIHVAEGSSHDVVLTLADVHQQFYINRALEESFTLPALKEKLLRKEVEIKYPSYWTPLDPNSQIRHVSKLSVDTDVLFNELKQK